MMLERGQVNQHTGFSSFQMTLAEGFVGAAIAFVVFFIPIILAVGLAVIVSPRGSGTESSGPR